MSDSTPSTGNQARRLDPPNLFEMSISRLEMKLEKTNANIPEDFRAIAGMIGMLSCLLSMGMFVSRLPRLSFGASTLELFAVLGWGFVTLLAFLFFLKWFKD